MNPSYWVAANFFRWFGRAFFNYRVLNREYLDVPGGALIVCNHASFLDPPLAGVAFEEAVHYMARKTLFDSPIGGAIIRSWQAIPVDQNRPDPGSLKSVIRWLKKGEKVLIFPEGQRTWDGQLLPGQPGVGFIVVKAGGATLFLMRLFGTHEAAPRRQACASSRRGYNRGRRPHLALRPPPLPAPRRQGTLPKDQRRTHGAHRLTTVAEWFADAQQGL